MIRFNASRSGLTLIELLVAVGIIGTLLAMLIPAIQKVREARNRIQCASNLKQLGLAAHQYEASRGRLPPAVFMPYAIQGEQHTVGTAHGPFGPNWAVYLLPHLEQDSIYIEANVSSYPSSDAKLFKTDAVEFDGFMDFLGFLATSPTYDLSWRHIRGKKLKAFVCPSDRGHDTLFSSADASLLAMPAPAEKDWARGNYAANAGAEKFEDSVNGENMAPKRGWAGAGVVCVNWGAKLSAQIPDGTSQTILFNEVRVGINALDRRGTWAMGFPGSSITAGNAMMRDGGTTNQPNDYKDDSDQIQGCYHFWYPGIGENEGMGCATFENDEPLTGVNSLNRIAQARSRHPGGVNSCFADGSVHFIQSDIPTRIWRSMLTRDGDATVEDKPHKYGF